MPDRPADTEKMPATLQAQINQGGNPNFTYLGPVKNGKTNNAYGLEAVSPDNIFIWRRQKGSWQRGGNAASKTQAKRQIARGEGTLND